MKRGGIILCGGRSTRMGVDKATLPFGPETMLVRVARLLREAVDVLVVVAAPTQELPALPGADEIIFARDAREGRGPLEGLAAGLEALPQDVEAAYVTSCDVPLLVPAVVRRMFDLVGECDIAVPVDDEHHHALAAVYRRRVLPRVRALLAADRLRPFFLFSQCRTREVLVETLRDIDPTLATLNNLNHPEDYTTALATAGYDLH